MASIGIFSRRDAYIAFVLPEIRQDFTISITIVVGESYWPVGKKLPPRFIVKVKANCARPGPRKGRIARAKSQRLQ
jgi:hypothetical protein